MDLHQKADKNRREIKTNKDQHKRQVYSFFFFFLLFERTEECLWTYFFIIIIHTERVLYKTNKRAFIPFYFCSILYLVGEWYCGGHFMVFLDNGWTIGNISPLTVLLLWFFYSMKIMTTKRLNKFSKLCTPKRQRICMRITVNYIYILERGFSRTAGIMDNKNKKKDTFPPRGPLGISPRLIVSISLLNVTIIYKFLFFFCHKYISVPIIYPRGWRRPRSRQWDRRRRRTMSGGRENGNGWTNRRRGGCGGETRGLRRRGVRRLGRRNAVAGKQ